MDKRIKSKKTWFPFTKVIKLWPIKYHFLSRNYWWNLVRSDVATVCGTGFSQAECLWIKLDWPSESKHNGCVSLLQRKLGIGHLVPGWGWRPGKDGCVCSNGDFVFATKKERRMQLRLYCCKALSSVVWWKLCCYLWTTDKISYKQLEVISRKYHKKTW